MEKQNPLENIRNAILASKLFGIENEISRLGVSDELMKISDALDSYYGIVRETNEEPSNEGGLIGVMNNLYRTNPPSYMSSLTRSSFSRFGEEKFSKVLSLLSRVKEPLSKMKVALSKENPLYLDISTMLVSIAVQNVVSALNSYQKPASYEYERYDPFTGLDIEYSNLITSGKKVFDKLSDYDMTQECYDNYKANGTVISSQAQRISDAILNPKAFSSSKKSSSSGCLVLALVLSTSMLSFFGIIVSLLL